MTHDIDELKLTGYALGELDGAECALERAEVEALLAADETAKRHVEEVRATARLVCAELAAEPVPGLTALQHAEIERRLEEAGRVEDDAGPIPIRPLRHNWAMWGSLAASIVIVCTVMANVLPMIYHIGSNPGGHFTGPGVGPIVIDPVTPAAPHEGGPIGVEPEPYARPDSAAFPSATPPLVRGENGFVRVADYPLSTMPMVSAYPDDADKGSFAAVRRSLANNQLPPTEAVRTDEIINALRYRYAPPRPGEPVGASIEVAGCPWNASHRLMRVGLRTADAAPTTQPAPATRPLVTPSVTGLTVQVEFNPSMAGAYRMVGYETGSFGGETRYESDESRPPGGGEAKSAGLVGFVGAGRTITALYEVIPAAEVIDPVAPAVAPRLKYQKLTPVAGTGRELVTVSVRCRETGGGDSPSRLLEIPVTDDGRTFAGASDDFRTAAAAATFAMLLRNSPYKGTATFDQVIDQVTDAVGYAASNDTSGERGVLLDLVKKAKSLSGR